jgi:hypothetical protein
MLEFTDINVERRTAQMIALERVGEGLLSRPSNRSLSAAPIPAGKGFGEARDRAGILGDDCIFCATETGRSRVSSAKAPAS